MNEIEQWQERKVRALQELDVNGYFHATSEIAKLLGMSQDWQRKELDKFLERRKAMKVKLGNWLHLYKPDGTECDFDGYEPRKICYDEDEVQLSYRWQLRSGGPQVIAGVFVDLECGEVVREPFCVQDITLRFPGDEFIYNLRGPDDRDGCGWFDPSPRQRLQLVLEDA